MRSRFIQSIMTFLAILPISFSQAKFKTQEEKLKLFEFNRRILEAAEDLGVDIVNNDISIENLEIILEQLRHQGIHINQIEIDESLLGSQSWGIAEPNNR